jgi:RNA polymerase sigma factor (sigma-70 family)
MPYRKERKDLLQTAMQVHGDTIYRLALTQMNSSADAEDIYQDVFLRLFKQKKSFNSDEHLKAWLLRVTINRCRDMYRSGWTQRDAASTLMNLRSKIQIVSTESFGKQLPRFPVVCAKSPICTMQKGIGPMR